MWITLFSPVMTNNSCTKLSVAKTPRLCDCHTEKTPVLRFLSTKGIILGRTSVKISLLVYLWATFASLHQRADLRVGSGLNAVSVSVHCVCVRPFCFIVLRLFFKNCALTLWATIACS